ncbi:MAG: zinc ribbon domain-containing protein [Bacteroidales bacterium]|nr:zinc ribbon domain-containing protein [Bacteroidales bacterium]
MATFNTKKILYGSTSLIPAIANRIQEEFRKDGYEVSMDALSSGGYDISITKGGIFKAVLGMKTALKVTLLPYGSNISFEAGVGIWGQQAIPTVISMLFFWPVLITQIWGMVEQSKLDDKALEIAESVICNNVGVASASNSDDSKFCTSCGTKNTATAKFCCGCGRPL